MQVLSIGNSFSFDGQRYVNGIAHADGVDVQTFNLLIGACSLEQHYRNMLSELPAYELAMNGKGTGFKVSIKDALLSRAWDVVTVQQNSANSFNYDTYQPYLNALVDYVRHCCPKTKIVLHQTWAYNPTCVFVNPGGRFDTHQAMFSAAKVAYDLAAAEIKADKLIPSGAVFQELVAAGETVHRDTVHASLGIGRYALGLIWYAVLTGRDITNNTFCDFDQPITPEQMQKAKACVKAVYEQYYG